MRHTLALLVLLTAGAALAPVAARAQSGAQLPVSTTEAAPRRAHRSRSVITEDEIRARHDITAWDLIQSLHPGWLRMRGASSLSRDSPIVVYVNGMRMGGVQTLREVQASSVVQVRYYDGAEAQTVFGMDHGSGAIVVTTG